MAQNKLRFSLTAYDPNPSEVTLAFDSKNCVVEESSNANITVEEYKTTPEGGPSEIFLKVTPDPIAFVMKFVDGKMTIEFKGNWAAFQVQSTVQTVANTEICFKVHLADDDVDAQDIRMNWNFNELSKLGGGGPFEIVYQKDTEKGREFAVSIQHPVTGETYIIRGVIKGDRVTILNTDKFSEEYIMLYLTFYIKDEGKVANIMAEMEANPDKKIEILYKWGAYAEAIDIASFVPYAKEKDGNGNTIPSKDNDDDDHVKKARAAAKKAEGKGKKGSGVPDDDKDWSCGKVKWELPKDDKKFRDVGKLKIPDFGEKDAGPNLADVGKLQWGGFEEEVKVKEKVKVGKLNMGAFGGGAAAEDNNPPPKRSWKKK